MNCENCSKKTTDAKVMTVCNSTEHCKNCCGHWIE